MFYDERINLECGKIYQRGILYTVLVTLIYGIGHGIYLYGEVGSFRFLQYLLLELSIIVCGGIILLMGAFQFGGEADERLLYEKHQYYLRASLVFLITALAGFAVSIPISVGKPFADVPLNDLVIILEVLGVLYLFYSFKKRDINFNYSFIDQEKREYYRHVYGNIGKFAAVVFLAYFFAAMLDYALHGSFLNLLSILISYLVSIVGLGLGYLLISFAEKRNYDQVGNGGIKQGTVVIVFVWLGFLALNAVLSVAAVFVSTGDLTSYPIPAGIILANFQYAIRYVGFVTTMLSAIAMTHFSQQIRASRAACRTLSAMLIVMAATVILALVRNFVQSCASETSLRFLAETGSYQNFVIFLIYMVLLCLFVRAMIKDFGVGKSLVLVPILYLLQALTSLLIYSLLLYRLSSILGQILLIGGWVLGLCLLRRCSFEKSEDGEKQAEELI